MSFIQVDPESHFPIENLPYGIFSTEANRKPRPGVAIGEYILDLGQIAHLFDGPRMKSRAAQVFEQTSLNDFMALEPEFWHEARSTLQRLLSKDDATIRDNATLRQKALVLQKEATMHLPAKVGDYTDFFSSYQHAKNCCEILFGHGSSVWPNWKYMPLAYHGRASSIVISGSPIRRPNGQILTDPSQPPIVGPCQAMDFEMEMAFFVGGNLNKNGEVISIDRAQEHIFGMVLLNDWSARDIQKWESTPLGPFLSKNLGTSISPWIVTMEALEHFKVPNVNQEPKPLPYLRHSDSYNFDVSFEAFINTSEGVSSLVSRTNLSHSYWTMKQMLAHHTITGCNTNPGDLMGTGTLSGPESDSFGCLLELTWNGVKPLKLKDGSERGYLKDGDEVVFTAYCQSDECKIGFGECRGRLLPPVSI